MLILVLIGEDQRLNYSETEARTRDIIGNQLAASSCFHIGLVEITGRCLVDTGHDLKSTAAEKGTETASPL